MYQNEMPQVFVFMTLMSITYHHANTFVYRCRDLGCCFLFKSSNDMYKFAKKNKLSANGARRLFSLNIMF